MMNIMDDRLRTLISNKTRISDSSGNTVEADGAAVANTLLHAYIEKYAKGCVSPRTVHMTGLAPIGGQAYITYAGIYKLKDFEDTYTSSLIPLAERAGKSIDEYTTDQMAKGTPIGELSTAILLSRKLFVSKLLDDDDISAIRTVFRNCPGDQYFYIPMTIHPIEKVYSFSHANGILLNKAKGTVMRIEPEYSVGESAAVDLKIKEGILRLCNEIGLKDPTWVEFQTTCPQAIAKDKNCLFWSMFLFKTVVENLYKDPNVVIQEVSSKSKEEVSTIIESFKKELVTKIIPQGLRLLKIRWPDFETQILGHPVIGQAPQLLGGKNGKRRTNRKTRRKHGISIRKTGKTRR